VGTAAAWHDRNMTRAWPGLLLAVLLGCGGGPEPTETKARGGETPGTPARETAPSAPRSPAMEDLRPKLVVLGDSITAGHGVEPGHAFPDYLQREIDAKGRKYHVVNAGISGDTTASGLDRLPSVLALKPDMVLLELGGNDGLRGLPLESTRANLEEMITRLLDAQVKVALAGMTLPANYGADYIHAFEKVYEDLAAKHKLKLILFRLDKVSGSDRAELMQPDGIHPNKEGQRRLGVYVAREMFR
jgi:acyl-CoA thioesterase-1